MNPSIISAIQQIRQNPMQILLRKYNIPTTVNTNNPNDIIQYLLNSGQVSQDQVNRAMGMRNDPMFQKLFGQQ